MYASSQRVHCSLSLPNEPTSTWVFIRLKCLTLSLNNKFEATLTHDIHWINVFTNKGSNHRKHRHQPFQKLAHIFVGLQLKIFKTSRVLLYRHFRSSIHESTIMLRVGLKFYVLYLADIELTCLPERTYKK